MILEVLDTAWKDHLYYMDHVRSGIGLVSYAQKDPKTEYRREGTKAFTEMWRRIGLQVTSAIFRLERESPDFVGSQWQVTSTTHDEFHEEQAPPQQLPGQQRLDPAAFERPTDSPPPVIKPIRNLQPHIGRNAPCPCGSGKKYKKCCGAAEKSA